MRAPKSFIDMKESPMSPSVDPRTVQLHWRVGDIREGFRAKVRIDAVILFFQIAIR